MILQDEEIFSFHMTKDDDKLTLGRGHKKERGLT